MMNDRSLNARTQYGRGGRSPDRMPRGQPEMNRSDLRAYNYQQDHVTDWSEAREFEPRQRPKQGRPTGRSQNFKGRGKGPKGPKVNRDVPDLTATTETVAKDEPLYEPGPHSTGTAVNELYCQNFDHAGFVDLVEETFEVMRGIDPRLDRRIPYCAFLHSMTSVLNAVQIDATKSHGEDAIPGYSAYAQDALPDDLIIPGPIHEYLSNIADTTSPSGDCIR